jgi:uncharacterized alkaline shock family protein YloU
MNIFNRIVMTLASLLIFAFGATVFLLLTGMVIPANAYLRAILALYNAYRAVALVTGGSPNIGITIAFFVGLVGLVLLVFELLPVGRLFHRPESKPYVLRQDTLGEVTLQRSMVRDLIEHEAESVPGVVHAEPEIHDGPEGLVIAVRASLAWDADAPGVGQALQERIKDGVQTHLGLQVSQVQVTATRELLTARRRESRRREPRVA